MNTLVDKDVNIDRENHSIEKDCVKIDDRDTFQYLPVRFHRAVCIHSSLQFIDLLIQSLMFAHGFAPTPVMQCESPSRELSRTLNAFEKVRKELCGMFRSKHRNTVSEVAIIIGASPIRSNYVYRIPINVCEAEDSSHDNCGDTCAELSDIERRKINRDLFVLRQSHEDPLDKHMRAKNNRMFVFVKGCDEMVGEDVEEDEPVFGSKPWNQYTFSHEKCNCDGVPSSSKDVKWLRVVPFIVPTKE